MLSSNGGRLAVATLVGAAALWLAFRGSDPSRVWLELVALPPAIAAAAVAVGAMTVGAQVIRWRTIIGASDRTAGWGSLTSAVLIGQATNILLPLRAGELARAYALGRSSSLPFQFVLATIAVERLADIAGVIVSAILLSSLTLPAALPRVSSRSFWIAGAVVALAAAAFLIQRFAPGLLARLRDGVVRRYASAAPALEGLRTLRHRRAMAGVAVMTAVSVFLAAATNYILLRGSGLALPPSAALAVLVVLQLGTAVASTPGNLGVFHYVTVLVLSAYGVDRATALAYAWALYALTIGPRLLAAAVCIAGRRGG